MTNASNVVTGTVRRALIPATLRAIVTPHVPHAKLPAMCNAGTRNADANATSLALLARSRNVFRNVLTARVQCLVQLPVIMYHALSAAKRSLPVVINAQGCVERDVLIFLFVRSAQATVSRTMEWILS
jgi:hypothetical protein